MALTAFATKRFGALRPADAHDEETFRDIKDGETVRIEITRANRRSLAHHRKLFALLHIVSEQLDWTTEQTLGWVKVATGHVDFIKDHAGSLTYIPRSISFAKMHQDDFARFFDAAVMAILDRLLPPGTPRADLVQEIEERAALVGRAA